MRRSFAALALLCAAGATPLRAEITIQRHPTLQETQTKTRSTTTTTGPNGTRVVEENGLSKKTQYPTLLNDKTVEESDSEVQVRGVENPGLTVERRVYLPTVDANGNGVYKPVVVEPEVKGGPGSVKRKSMSETTETPKIRVMYSH